MNLEPQRRSVSQWFEHMSSNESPEELIGTVLSGKYRVVQEVGRGGMAAVYEARHVEIGKRVAIKVLNPELAAVSSVVERFIREARAAAAIESPHICGMHDVDRLDDGRPYLVMDFLEGESLFQRLQKLGRFEPLDVVRIFSQIARGLQKAHDSGIIHRDLKPENVFLARNDEGEESAKIVDFGLAKFYEGGEGSAEKRLTRDGAIFGTPLYMSPEQVVGDGKVDYRADLWALGCMAYECLTGHSVWNNDRGLAMVLAQIAAEALPVPSQRFPGLPKGFDGWFFKALDRDPDLRFQSARELASELAIALGYELMRQPMKSTSALTDLGEISGRFQIVPLRSGAPTAAAIDIIPVPPAAIEPVPVALRQETRSVVEIGTSSPVPSGAAAARPSRVGAIVAAVAIISAVAGGFALGLKFLSFDSRSTPANGSQGSAAGASSTSALAPSGSAPSSAQPLGSAAPLPANAPGWVQTISQGQDELARGNISDAVRSFERAAEANDSGMIKLMLDHAKIAAGSKGACRMTGLGRPRSHEQSSAARHSAIVSLGAGTLASWIDEHRGAGQPSVSAALIDASLRTWPAVDLTPEGSSVTEARLVASNGKAALFWGEGVGPAAGVYARSLDSRGTPSGEPVRVSEGRTTATNASAALAPSGDWWVIYADETPKSSANLFARKLDASLKLQGEAVQLTEFAAIDGPLGPRVSGPETAIIGDSLVVSYRIERGQKHDVMVQRIPLSEPSLAKGVAGSSKPGFDAFVGASTRVSQTQWKVQAPEMACDKVVCLVVWRGDPSGVNMAAIDPGNGVVRWRKVVSATGMQAGVGLDGAGHGLVAWYEDGRLRTAPVTLDGIGAGGLAGRVGGDQPGPTVAWANGSWLVGWSSFEGGHPEAYLQRVVCQ